ncbi:hypothetical protein L596_008910 [Steinernema carpocapsae]|uniref:Uncharacterized protein n=1 Tax=Steinernema carpocapsae TaxID=34508 RepID=A0A4U5PDU7_STECR|nr:hypothetical protein L596_008910 [Steinernema carpocapsae]
MQLTVFLCLLLVLPVALAQAQCSDIQDAGNKQIDAAQFFIDQILDAACDKPSKSAVLKHMIKNFEDLLFRLGKPCVFTFTPTHFQYPSCLPIQWQFSSLYELFTGINWELDQLCLNQCSVPNEYADKIKNYINKLLDILNNL